jgi:pyruvate ferredoxin oxidoreductase gamma subunit
LTEIIWHGRGGQGAFTAARLLGAAYALSGENGFSLAFPSFGPERRGAPVRAFTKLDSAPIGNRSEVEKADYSIFLDETLFSDHAFSELKLNGKILLNTKRSFEDKRIITIDATTLAIEILKQPITNTIMLGAFSAIFDGIHFENVEASIRQYMPRKLQNINIKAAEEAKAAILLNREVWL